MAAVVDRLSTAMWPTAYGLLIGLMSACGTRYLTANLEVFDGEMEGAALELGDQLAVPRYHQA
jgi:hypothetical protein